MYRGLWIYLALIALSLSAAGEGCTIENLVTEYSEGSANSRSYLTYNGVSYTLVRYADERFIVANGAGCNIVDGVELNKNLITNSILIEETRGSIDSLVRNYTAIHDCYGVTEYSNGVCTVVGVIQTIYDSAAGGLLDIAGEGIVNAVGMIDGNQKKSAQSIYKKVLRYVKKGKEKQVVGILFDTCREIKENSERIRAISVDSQKKALELKSGSVTGDTLQGIRSNNKELLTYLDSKINEANVGRIADYISTEAVDTVKREINSLTSDEDMILSNANGEQLDPVGIILTLAGGEKCSGFRKNGGTYVTIQSFQSQIEKSIEEGTIAQRKSAEYLMGKRTLAHQAIQSAETLKAGSGPGFLGVNFLFKTESEDRYKQGVEALERAKQNMNNNLYISAKNEADKASQYFKESIDIAGKSRSLIDLLLENLWIFLIALAVIAMLIIKRPRTA